MLFLLRSQTNSFQEHWPLSDFPSPRDEIVDSSAKGQWNVSVSVFLSVFEHLPLVSPVCHKHSISYKNTWESWWRGRWWCVASWSTIMLQQRQMSTLYTFQNFIFVFSSLPSLSALNWFTWFISGLLILSLKMSKTKLDPHGIFNSQHVDYQSLKPPVS